MIEGISIQRYPSYYHIAYHVMWGIEIGWQIGYRNGENWDTYLSEDEGQVMNEIEKSIGENQVDGFTIFKVKAGWQMSFRRQEDHGWSIQIVPDEQAAAILSMIEASGHPKAQPDDAAWKVLGEACRGLTAAIHARVA